MANAELVAALQQIAEIADVLGQPWRVKAYKHAALSVAAVQTPIVAGAIPRMPGVGTGIMQKIQEFVETGRIAEIARVHKSREYQAHVAFNKIIGVGPATAHAWVEQGILTLAALRRQIARGKIVLNAMQKHGLLYYDDLNTRIPRAEVATVAAEVTRLLPGVACEIVGSYRRACATSGDIDMIATTEQHDPQTMTRFTQRLAQAPALVATLSAGAERVTFLWRSASSQRVRQVDVLYIAQEIKGACLLYFTGSYDWNIVFRAHAKRLGYRLNQRGLYLRRADGLQLVPTTTERSIFERLGVRWVEPAQRTAAAFALVDT